MTKKSQSNGNKEVTPDGSNQLPEGWIRCTVSDVTATVPNYKPSDEPDREFNYIDISSIDNVQHRVAGMQTFRGNAAPSRARRPVRPGDVLFSNVRTYLRNIGQVPQNIDADLCSTGFTVMRSNGAVLSDYLFQYAITDQFVDPLTEKQTGSSYPAVTDRVVLASDIPLPPLAEQKRIVAKVEALLDRVSKARERLDRVPGILKKFRQSVLAAACSGRLTADWRAENSGEPDAAVIPRIRGLRQERFEANNSTRYRTALEPRLDRDVDFPEQWTLVSLDFLTCLVTSGSRGWAKYYSDSGPLFVRAQNIRTDKLVLDQVAHVTPPDTAEGRRTRVQRLDLLITITGANVTRTAIVDSELTNAYVSQHVAIARLVETRMAPFLYIWLISPAHGRDKLISDAYGAGKPGLNLTNIRDMPVALPSLAEQEVIAQRVTDLLALADRIEESLYLGEAKVERISRSILAKAFAGELVETEAELARREGRDYESADVLLERIAAEREAAANGKPKRAKSRRK